MTFTRKGLGEISELAADKGWQRVLKFPDEGKEPQRGSSGISFIIFVILAVGVFACVTR
jgi:hypothetical protein